MGTELPQAKDFSVTATQEKFTREVRPIPTSPALWVSRQRPQSVGETRNCMRKLAELRPLPGICAHSAQSAAKVDSLQVRDVYRTHALTKTIESPQASKPHEFQSVLCVRALALAKWSDDASGDRTKEGRRRPVYIIAFSLSFPLRPCQIIHWVSAPRGAR